MRRGFALLETIVVITLVMVSLLLLYSTFTNMIFNSRKNILYDDVTNIYRMYYLKEYLTLNDLESKMNGEIRELSCEDFSFSSCSFLFNELELDHLYLVRTDLEEYDDTAYTSTFNQYLASLSKSDEYSYYLVGEFLIQEEYQYASIGVMQL